LGVWLIRLGVQLSHNRPLHPQTNGKDERFHRTLKAELITRKNLLDMSHTQQEFDAWRQIYNHHRPHEAIQMQTPSQRYQASQRIYDPLLAPIEYQNGDWVRKVDQEGRISFKGHEIECGWISPTSSVHGTTRFISSRNIRLRVRLLISSYPVVSRLISFIIIQRLASLSGWLGFAEFP
jgi:Integrase core domain